MNRQEMSAFLRKFEQSLQARFHVNPTVDLQRRGKLTDECVRRLVVYAHDALPWPDDHPEQDPEEIRKEAMRRGSPELQAFSESVKAQIKERGCESGPEFVRAYPGEHLWAMMDGYESCAFCGVCKSRDPGGNGPCKGIVGVSLR